MFYIEIQKGKEAMHKFEFQQDIGGMAACMKKILKAIKGCGQLSY